ADDGHAFAGVGAGLEELHVARGDVIERVALQIADADRRIARRVIDARAFAKFFGRTDARAARAHGIGVHDRRGAALDVAGRDFLNERGHVDVRRARVHARRIVAIQTAIRLERNLNL